MTGDLLAEPIDTSIVTAQQTRQAEKERGFSRARPAYHSDNLARFHIEAHIAQGGNRHCSRSGAGVVRLVEASHGQRDPHAVSPREKCRNTIVVN